MADTKWNQSSVLIVDDEEGMRSFLARALVNKVNVVRTAASAEEGATLLEREHFDLIILDISLPGKLGVEWLEELRNGGFGGDVILITAFADMETAIGALRAGASDFVLKPFRVDQIMNSIRRCFDRARLARENFVLRREINKRSAVVSAFVGDSPALRNLGEMIHRVAPTPSTVLILGESGTGKEVVARALHEHSNRVSGPFVPVNCGAISPEIIESELFGHLKGAFTGANESRNGLFYYANGGTLFLDEVSELPLPMQTKLLRVLEERRIRPLGSEKEVPVDVRIIAASNRQLSEEVTAGRFRQDLYFRLDVVELKIPPLRERREDIAPLAEHFVDLLSRQLGFPAIPITPSIRDCLSRYDWPGNARELRNFIERSLILGYYPTEQLPGVEDEEPLWQTAANDADQSLEEMEKRHIISVLAQAGGNKSEAARRLGISRKTLDRKFTSWGMPGYE